ncbi:MAG: J domain-containing protein [Methylobacter sp.]
MANIHTHYDNLKVARNAPISVIKAAHKALCQTYHPDKFQRNTEEAERIIKIVNASYTALINPVTRAKHDRWINKQEAKTKQSEDTQFSETDEITQKQHYQNQEHTQPLPPKSTQENWKPYNRASIDEYREIDAYKERYTVMRYINECIALLVNYWLELVFYLVKYMKKSN